MDRGYGAVLLGAMLIGLGSAPAGTAGVLGMEDVSDTDSSSSIDWSARFDQSHGVEGVLEDFLARARQAENDAESLTALREGIEVLTGEYPQVPPQLQATLLALDEGARSHPSEHASTAYLFTGVETATRYYWSFARGGDEGFGAAAASLSVAYRASYEIGDPGYTARAARRTLEALVRLRVTERFLWNQGMGTASDLLASIAPRFGQKTFLPDYLHLYVLAATGAQGNGSAAQVFVNAAAASTRRLEGLDVKLYTLEQFADALGSDTSGAGAAGRAVREARDSTADGTPQEKLEALYQAMDAPYGPAGSVD